MLKGKYIGLCAMALISAAVLAGCGGKELSERESAGGEGRPTEESLKEGCLTEESLEEGSTEEGPKGGNSIEENSEKERQVEDIASSYPKIAKLPADKWIDLVMYSEGCYCIYDGSHYGFMTEEGEEITPYI
ncbi:MAG: hypothetical protein K2K63_11740, partial [Acetatifactor sp.]|nr:hypothetical protein [Acetatifactor sp.]